MQFQDIYEMCKKAFEEDKVKELLIGTEGFICEPDKSVPASIPTDWSLLFEKGIYKLRNFIADEIIRNKIQEAFFELLKGSPVEIWVAFSVFFEMFYNERKGYAELFITTDEMKFELSKSLKNNELELKECFLWQGKNKKDGLWNDISGANKSMNQLFGVTLL